MHDLMHYALPRLVCTPTLLSIQSLRIYKSFAARFGCIVTIVSACLRLLLLSAFAPGHGTQYRE